MLTPYYISEVLAALASSIYFYKYRQTPMWLIMPILWLAVITETVGHLYFEYIYPNNHWIYNIYAFLYYGLFYLIIYWHVKHPKRRKVILYLSIAVMVVFIINCYFTNPITKPLTYATIAGTLIMTIHLMFACIEVLKSTKILKLKNSLPFFIFGGYLIIEVALIPISLIRNVDIYSWTDEVYHGVNHLLGAILIIVNALFIFAFSWTQPSIGVKE